MCQQAPPPLMPMTRRISLSRLCWCGARSSSAASTIPSDTSRRTVWRNRCGSGRARLRPKAGSRASAVRSAAICPTGPGRFPGAQRRGQRGPCGLRRVHRRAGQGPGVAATRPRPRAACRPASVRSAIRARSSWATAPSTCSENVPCGVVAAIGSRRLRKCAPLASNCSMTVSIFLGHVSPSA